MNGSEIDFAWIFLIPVLPYLYLTIRVLQGLMRIEPSTPKPSAATKVSVIIITNKKPETLDPLLDDLSLQDYSHDSYEIIIGDDSPSGWSDDDIKQRAFLPHLKVVPNRGNGKKAALECAMQVAEGELIITTDDDCRVDKNWILSIASHFRQYKPGMIICPVELAGSPSWFVRMQQLEFFSLQGVTAGTASLGDPIMCNGAGLAFRRDLFPEKKNSLKGRILSGDDVFLLHYLKKRRIKIDWIESTHAVVRTHAAPDLKSFIRQRARWASKASYYNDKSTSLTALAVLLSSLTLAACMILTFFNPAYLKTTIILLLIKSVPDSLIIMNRLHFHGKPDLLWYFPPALIVYPFYIVITAIAGFFRRESW